jgi:hypothetical protein
LELAFFLLFFLFVFFWFLFPANPVHDFHISNYWNPGKIVSTVQLNTNLNVRDGIFDKTT